LRVLVRYELASWLLLCARHELMPLQRECYPSAARCRRPFLVGSLLPRYCASFARCVWGPLMVHAARLKSHASQAIHN
jgi:hypothetical protein